MTQPTSPSVVLLDYGAGNIRSAQRALEHVGASVTVTDDPKLAVDADGLVVPGVGAFGACAANLRAVDGLEEALTDAATVRARPFLGICVGMQLMADAGEEHGEHAGLGWIPGRVRRLVPDDQAAKVPHMGWSALHFPRESKLYTGLSEGEMTYFVHSYHALAEDESVVAARGEHGEMFVAGVERENVMGAQFHPEKSSAAGLKILDNFARL